VGQELGERAPAPGNLALLQAFINTNNLNTGRDLLSDPGTFAAWATANGLLSRHAEVTQEVWLLAIELREALRDLLAGNNGKRVEQRSVSAFNQCARSIGLQVLADREGSLQLSPMRAGADAALGRLLSVAVTARVAGTWNRLKVCREEHCRWVFYDRSKNRSATWCTMTTCGSRAKARAYRQRQQVLISPS
jgi:predicted RNA-binding Zn ribbon-like protein